MGIPSPVSLAGQQVSSCCSKKADCWLEKAAGGSQAFGPSSCWASILRGLPGSPATWPDLSANRGSHLGYGC